MTMVPPSSENFSGYYKNYLSRIQPSQTGGAVASFSEAAAPVTSEKLGFLGRFVDLLSRPLRTISNPAMKAVEMPLRMDKVQELRLAGDDAGAIKEGLSAVGSLIAAPITGFFSDNPENKPYWSDIIEKQSDVANRNDPNYVDTANNVNPVLKGTVGFVGDFLLDPLWLVPGIGVGTKLFGTAARGTKIVADVAEANAAAARQADEIFTLSTKVGGKDRAPQTFNTFEEAQAALAAQQRKGSRPWVNADEVEGAIPRGTNSYTITRQTRERPVNVPPAAAAEATKAANLPDTVPASTISQRLADEITSGKPKKGETSSEFLARTVGNMLDNVTAKVGGKEVNLKSSLVQVLTDLSRAAAPAAKAAGKPATFDAWLGQLAKDSKLATSLIRIPESLVLRGAGFGAQSTIKNLLNVYRDTRNTQVKDAIRALVLEPSYAKYAAGVKGGKAVNALGEAASSAAVLREVEGANSAARLLNTLSKLDDANAARLGELLGDEFVAILRQTDPQGIAQFLDDLRVILTKTGTIETLGRATPGSLLGAALDAFDVDAAYLARQVAEINRRVGDIPTTPQKSTAQAAESLADDAATQAAARETLSEAGFADEVLDSAEKITRPVETLGKAIYEKSRKAWAGAKNAYIKRNKKRLGLEDVDYDFANPQISIYAPQIAKAYDSLVSDPSNPAVREAYDALIRESREQYDYMTRELGIEVEFVPYDPYNVAGKNGQMVPDSKLMMEDVTNNRHLFVRDSAEDFAKDPHPILSVEDNNIFRAVHEFFGHAASGSNFRAAGEEGAWVSHSSMFSLPARRALTTETRGQNSYYNFFDPQRKEFAPQKAALLPDEYVQLPTREDLKAFDIQVLIDAGYPEESVLKAEKAGRPAKGLMAAVLSALQAGLPASLRRKVDDKYLDKYYPHELGGARKSDPNYLEGVGVIPKEPSTYFQFDLFLGVAKAVQDLVVGAKQLPIFKPNNANQFFGVKLAKEKERLAIAAMKIAEDFLIERGMPLTFDYQGVFHNMRFSQAYKAVQAALDRSPTATNNYLTYIFFNANTGVAPTQFMEAIARGLSGGSRDDVFDLLTSAVDRNGKIIGKTKGESLNFLAGPEKIGRMGNFRLSNIETAEKITDAIMDALPDLQRISRSNAADYAARAKAEGTLIAQDAADFLVGLINSPEKLAEALRATAYSERVVGDMARTINATELGASTANAAVKAGIGPGMKRNAEEMVDLEKATLSGDSKKVEQAKAKMLESAEEFQARVRREAEELVEDVQAGRVDAEDMTPGVIDDVAETAAQNAANTNDKIATDGYGTMWAWAAKVLDPLNKIFNARRGMHTKEMPWGHRMFAAQANSLHVLASRFLVPLRAIAKNNEFAAPLTPGSKTSVLQQAVRNIQNGVRSPEGTILRQAEDAYRPILARVVDTSNDIQNFMLGNAFFRSGAGIDALNDVLAFNKVLGDKTPPNGIYFDRDLAERAARERIEREAVEQRKPLRPVTEEDVMREIFDQWKTWDIEDPINFAYNLNRAAIQVATESGFVTAFKAKAFATGVGSASPQKDFVKFTFADDSRYAKYFGDEPLYLHPDAAEMLEAIDTFAKSNKAFEGAFGQFVRTTLDPVTDVWKYAITLPRPGHHIRNLVGDTTLTYLAEGGFKALAAARHAFRTMGIKGSYEDVDVVRLLTGAGLEMPKRTTVAVPGIKLKGGTVDLTYADAYEQMLIKGLLPPAKGREGLYKGRGFDEQEMVETKFSRALEKGAGVLNPLAIRGGRIEDAIMNVAEGRDHFIRMQHFWQIIEKAKAGKKLTAGFGKFVDPRKMTLDELIIFAVDRVGKYHPDLSTLSVFERKYLKRLMPFYHWNRGAFQAVMETLVMSPGRIMAFPKAGFNIAVAAGINPYSLYDPFPTDQLFPSFLSEEMQGPQFEVGGRYYGVRPGITTFDVLNQVSSANPIDVVMSNLNPAFKIPLELLTGTRIDTGVRIRDYSDYIDSSIPGVNYASNISSYSLSGTLASLLTGGGFDRQLQYELGNKDASDQLISAVNWLTGIGLVDYSRPSYIRIAQNEMREEMQPQTRPPF